MLYNAPRTPLGPSVDSGFDYRFGSGSLRTTSCMAASPHDVVPAQQLQYSRRQVRKCKSCSECLLRLAVLTCTPSSTPLRILKPIALEYFLPKKSPFSATHRLCHSDHVTGKEGVLRDPVILGVVTDRVRESLLITGATWCVTVWLMRVPSSAGFYNARKFIHHRATLNSILSQSEAVNASRTAPSILNASITSCGVETQDLMVPLSGEWRCNQRKFDPHSDSTTSSTSEASE